jgi:3-phosphoshikimate 1-carboxyvinyltransferase
MSGAPTPGAGTALPIAPLTAPFDATVTIPGSKSITNRALLVAALARGTSRVSGVLRADDTEAMLGALGALGVGLEVVDDGTSVVVAGVDGRFPVAGADVDARQAGTVARFVAPALAAGAGVYRLDGHPQLRARPLGPLVTSLRALGVEVTETVPGHLPIVVHASGWRGGSVEVAGDVSSQYLSGLLIAGPCATEGLRVTVTTELVSRPYVDMTLAVMAAFGADAGWEDDRTIRVAPRGYRATDYAVEPDASAASYVFAAAAVTGSRVVVPGLGAGSLQGDLGFVHVLEEMGAEVEVGADATTVRGTGALRGVVADLRDLSDTVPTLAVTAAFAVSPTTITGVGFIRNKESDRIGAVVTELRRCGVEATEDADGLTVLPVADGPHGARVHTYEDHRIAMSFALVGLRVPGIEILDPGCVAKTFPEYFTVLGSLRDSPAGTPADRVPGSMRVIAIDGPAGSGKSTVSRALARRLGLEYLDTGAMYRAIAFAAIRRGIDPEDTTAVARLAREVQLEVGERGVVVDGVDATLEIRGPEVTRSVSTVAANPEVRRELVSRQREWAHLRGGGVLEGRDIGSVVFPDAQLKVYLTASAEARAQRRAKEVADLDYETVAADIARRDAVDSNRADSPLVEAEGAVVVDTTGLSVDEVVARVVELLP